MRKGTVYVIRDQETGKVYVGSTVTFSQRRACHLRQLRAGKHHSVPLQRAFSKRGEDAFCFDILEANVHTSFLVEREQYWLDRLHAADPAFGYNVSPTAGSPLGVRHSAATRAKDAARMREQHRLRPFSEDARRRILLAKIGNKHAAGRQVTAETRAKISRANKGRRPTPETRAKLKIARRCGAPVSDETRRKLSASAMGNTNAVGAVRSPEWRTRVAEGVWRARRKGGVR